MKKRWKYLILFIVLIQLAIVFVLTVLPPIVQALPGEMRVRIAQVPLGGTLLYVGTTPMPTALPVPANAVAQKRITIPTVSTATMEPIATETAVSTQPSQESLPAETAPPTITPTATPLPTNTPTPVPLPPKARIEGVEIMPQGFNNCGPANLTINLNFYGDTTTQTEAAAFLKPNREDRNVSPWQMVDYVNEQTDMRAFFGSGGDIRLLKQLIAAGYPVVIEKGYELPREGWLGHYLTLFGYDDETGEMVSMDTNLGPWDGSGRYDSYEDIEKYWSQFNYNFFVVYPPEKETAVFAILGADMLDNATMWQHAAEKAQAAIDENEENAFAWFNLGTSLTRLGELSGEAAFYENGAAAFDQAFILGLPPRMLWYQYRPYIAYMKVGRYQEMLDLADAILTTQGGQNVEETYLYKGHALAFLGDGAGAVTAYKQALARNENFYPAQWALDSITGG
jgi:hypothetical protein